MKLLVWLLLLLHVNFNMFIPNIDEVDQLHVPGKAIDEINSLPEYIDQIILGHADSTPEDEDDDGERTSDLIKTAQVKYVHQLQQLWPNTSGCCEAFYVRTKFLEGPDPKFSSVIGDIEAPPPKA